jgi:hypothetical protein
MYPCIVIFIGLSARSMIDFLLAGRWVGIIKNSTVIMSNGTATFLFLFLVSGIRELRLASTAVIFITISYIIYRISKVFEDRIFIDSVIKAFAYIIAGISFRFMFVSLWPIGFWEVGFKISAGDLVLFSFLGIAVMQMLSLIDLTGSKKLANISMWLKRNQGSKFWTMFAMFYLLYNLRGDIMGGSILGEWIFIFVVLLVAFIILAIKLKNAVVYAPEEKLEKHFQDVSYSKIKDITNISKYINDFVRHGSKSGIVSCLYYMACKAEISIGTASRIISPVIEYKDMEYPGIATRKSYMVVEERNRQNRTKIIENVIYNFEYYGRGVGDFNEFGKTSGTMQHYN